MDQAERLRDLVRKRERSLEPEVQSGIKIYTISSGKGGVGKTNIVINLAIALQRRGKKVLIIDADLGMANVNVVLGVYPKYSLYDVLFHKFPLKSAVITSYEGIKVLPGGSGMIELAMLDIEQQEAFAKEFLTLKDIDIILIDTGAGISKNSLSFISFSQELILITTPEPTSLTDAYSLVKILNQYKLDKNVKVIVNRCSDSHLGNSIYEKLNSTSEVFLHKTLENLGYIYDDGRVMKSVMNQVPFLIQYPKCIASECINRIADELLGRKGDNSPMNSIQQVYKRLLKVFG